MLFYLPLAMQVSNTRQTQNTNRNDKVVLTKVDSRSNETQKRMYSSPDGKAFKLVTKDIVTLALEEMRKMEVPSTKDDSNEDQKSSFPRAA